MLDRSPTIVVAAKNNLVANKKGRVSVSGAVSATPTTVLFPLSAKQWICHTSASFRRTDS